MAWITMMLLKPRSHAAFILTNIERSLVSQSTGAGSQVDLLTPPPKLNRRGSVDGSGGKGTQKQPSGYFPDNQLGLEDSPPGVFAPSPNTQPEAGKPNTPKTRKHTAAKSQAKPKARAPASVHKRVRGKTSPVHGPTGESEQTKPVHNEGTAGKDGQETQQAKKTPQKGSTVKTRKESKGDKGAAVKAKTSKGDKVKGVKDNKDKASAAKDKTSKGAETKHIVEYDGTQKVRNPGGRSSSSGINKKRHAEQETRDKQPEKQAAKTLKISDNNSNKAPAERKENDETAVVAALQRADTLEQQEKAAAEQEKLAKRKAYKARKQRFYNSLSSAVLVV